MSDDRVRNIIITSMLAVLALCVFAAAGGV